jgi:hypothetical protein
MSVVWGITWRLELRRRIPGRSFHPSPTVDTAWLMGERRSRPLIDPADLPSFERFVRDRFRHASLPIRRTLRAPRRDLEPQASRQRPGRSIYRSRNGSRSTNGSRDDDDMMRARREPGKAMNDGQHDSRANTGEDQRKGSGPSIPDDFCLPGRLSGEPSHANTAGSSVGSRGSSACGLEQDWDDTAQDVDTAKLHMRGR